MLLPLAILGQLSGQLSKELMPLKPPMDLLLDNSNLLWSVKAYTRAPWSSNLVFLLLTFLFFVGILPFPPPHYHLLPDQRGEGPRKLGQQKM